MSAAVGKTVPGLTNPYPIPPKKAVKSDKKRNRGGRNRKKNAKKENKEPLKHCDNNPISNDDIHADSQSSSCDTLPAKSEANTFENFDPEEMIAKLRIYLEKAREEKDHKTANTIRQKIWLLKDVAAGVVSNISEEDMKAILIQTGNLKLADSSN